MTDTKVEKELKIFSGKDNINKNTFISDGSYLNPEDILNYHNEYQTKTEQNNTMKNKKKKNSKRNFSKTFKS